MKIPKSQPVFGESGAGCTFTNTGNGIIINVPNNTAGLSRRPPLNVYLTSDQGVPQLAVQPGIVNGFIPKIGGQFIDKLPAPKLPAGAGIIYVRVERQSNNPFPANVEILKGSTVPTDDSTYGHYTLASVAENNGKTVIYNYVSGNLMCHRLSVLNAPFLYFWAIV